MIRSFLTTQTSSDVFNDKVGPWVTAICVMTVWYVYSVLHKLYLFVHPPFVSTNVYSTGMSDVTLVKRIGPIVTIL